MRKNTRDTTETELVLPHYINLLPIYILSLFQKDLLSFN